jgi:hypothetical protein
MNSVEVHPQLSNKGHPVDGVLVDAGPLWLFCYPYGGTPTYIKLVGLLGPSLAKTGMKTLQRRK